VRREMISRLLEIIRLFCKRALCQMRSTCALHALWYVRIEMISRLLEIIRLFCKRALCQMRSACALHALWYVRIEMRLPEVD